jgi:hypothetical protein
LALRSVIKDAGGQKQIIGLITVGYDVLVCRESPDLQEGKSVERSAISEPNEHFTCLREHIPHTRYLSSFLSRIRLTDAYSVSPKPSIFLGAPELL